MHFDHDEATTGASRFAFNPEIIERLKEFDPHGRSREGHTHYLTDPKLQDLISIASHELRNSYSQISQRSYIIEQLEAEIFALKHDQEVLMEYLDVCKQLATSSPIQVLPTEILCQIFDFYCDIPNIIQGKENAEIPVFKLMHVCSRWRTAAVSSPSLWSTIIWKGSLLTSDLLKFILAQTGSAELYLMYEGASGGGSTFMDEHILPYLTRCKTLNTLHTSQILQYSGVIFYALQHLELRNGGGPKTMVDLTSSAPNLRSLSILYDNPNLKVKWENLDCLKMLDCTPLFVLRQLKRCSKLQSLHIYIAGTEPNMASEVDRERAPIILEHLKVLQIVEVKLGNQRHVLQAAVQHLLDMLLTPNLSSLNISEELLLPSVDIGSNNIKMPSPLCDMIERSQCAITTLIVSCTSRYLHRLLDHFPFFLRLETLKCNIKYHSRANIMEPTGDMLFLNLAIRGCDTIDNPDAQAIALPCLRQLDITTDSSLFTDTVFVSMVQSRWNVVPGKDKTIQRLESVSLRMLRRSNGTSHHREVFVLWSPLREMQKDGLRVAVRDGGEDVRTRTEAAEFELV